MKTPIELLDEYSTYVEEGGINTYEDGELLDLIIEVTQQKPNLDGLPTDRETLLSINNALYHHFNEESNL